MSFRAINHLPRDYERVPTLLAFFGERGGYVKQSQRPKFIDRPLEISTAKTEAAITKAYDRKLKDMWFGAGYSAKARAFTVAAQ
jgi:hypothetical protein